MRHRRADLAREHRDATPDEPPPGGDLAPLTVHAFQRTFGDFPIVHASNVSGDPNIRLAIYEEGSCERKPDNFRALDGKQYYFVFVNSSFDQAAHWQVSLKINQAPSPGS